MNFRDPERDRIIHKFELTSSQIVHKSLNRHVALDDVPPNKNNIFRIWDYMNMNHSISAEYTNQLFSLGEV